MGTLILTLVVIVTLIVATESMKSNLGRRIDGLSKKLDKLSDEVRKPDALAGENKPPPQSKAQNTVVLKEKPPTEKEKTTEASPPPPIIAPKKS